MSSDLHLHVGFFSPQLPDNGSSNGVVTYTRIMRDALRALGHSVTVVSGNQIEHKDGRIGDLRKPAGIRRRLRLLAEMRLHDDGCGAWNRLRVVEAFEAARAAGVHVFEIEETFGWAGRLTNSKVPIVERLHGPHVFGREVFEPNELKAQSDLREAAELASFTRVDSITCPSRFLLDALISKYSLADLPARVIPNPIAVAPLGHTWEPNTADLNQILCVGRFDLRKGADLVLRAFAKAAERLPRLRLVMVGPDFGLTREDGRTIHFDEFMSTELAPETRERVQFLGSQSPARVAELRLQSAFAIVGSRFENFPYSIAEAMAVGMPVLASDVFGNRELIRDNIDGKIVPVADVSAMANAIVALASDPPRLCQMGRSSYRRAADWLSPDRIASETVAVYVDALKKRSGTVALA